MGEMGNIVQSADDLVDAVVLGRDAYTSRAYLEAEREKLWRHHWLQAGRVEDIPNPGDFITYDILDDSVIITRADDGGIAPLAATVSMDACLMALPPRATCPS